MKKVNVVDYLNVFGLSDEYLVLELENSKFVVVKGNRCKGKEFRSLRSALRYVWFVDRMEYLKETLRSLFRNPLSKP